MILEEFRLDGQVAVVTGADSPEGQAILAGLAEAGAKVSGLRQRGGPVAGKEPGGIRLDCDLKSDSEVTAAIARVRGELGAIDILVNAHQVAFARPFLETTPEQWRDLVGHNVLSAAVACRAVGGEMIERGRGKIVNLASGMGARGLPDSVPYATTEGAVMQLTAALAIEWAPHGIKVNAAAPVWLESGAPVDGEETLLKYIPMRRRGRLEELANLVVFLACDGSHFLTGKTVFLDGAVLSHA